MVAAGSPFPAIAAHGSHIHFGREDEQLTLHGQTQHSRAGTLYPCIAVTALDRTSATTHHSHRPTTSALEPGPPVTLGFVSIPVLIVSCSVVALLCDGVTLCLFRVTVKNYLLAATTYEHT